MKFSGKLTIPPIFKKSLSLLYWVALFLLLAAELWVVAGSVRLIQQSQEIPVLNVTRQVRVNFTDYDKAMEKIEQGSVYVPAESGVRSPFGD